MKSPNVASRRALNLLWLAAALLLAAGCASAPLPENPSKAYVAPPAEDLFVRYAPVFVVRTHAESLNRIGSAAARLDGDDVEVYIDPEKPIFYAQKQEFKTDKGAYVNLIYRVHFERIPSGYLSSGRNVGLFIILTLNAKQEPVLVTAVHTCGCYLGFVPTSYLPADALPEGWRTSPQEVHGETLPGRLNYPKTFDARYRPVVFLRDDTHRVMDLRVMDVAEAEWRYDAIPAPIRPMAALREIPVGGRTTSFFHTSGSRKGYVKGSRKPWEMFLMGVWTMDFYVGRDKDLGDSDETGARVYTSLKPWSRETSDLWHFAWFLKHWGWRL